MTFINKQRFLAELGKLLTFMYEEDRQRAVEMYSRMFEEAADEQALIQSLISPTRQAVVVARAYNSNLGKLSLTSESKAAPEDRDDNGIPDYVQAIESVRAQALPAQGVPSSAENKEKPAEEKPAEEKPEENAEPEEAPAEAEPEENAEPEAVNGEESGEPSEAEPEETAAEGGPDQEKEPEQPEESSGEAGSETVSEPEEESLSGSDSSPEEEESPKEEAAAEEEAEPEETEPSPEQEELPASAESTEEDQGRKPEGIEIFTMPEAGKETPESETLLDENAFNIDSEALRKPRRKPKVFALILYILLAIPLTICAIAILLVPAILFLALSVATIIGGVVLVSAAFKGFAVFADMMVVLGVSMVLFALGLLFLWTAIWFIGGAIVGVVHGVAVLCEKWCYKEVLEA